MNKSSVLRPLSCERNVFNYRESFILDSSAIIHSNILIRCWDSCTVGALWWIEFALTNFECAIIYFCYDDFAFFIDWMHYVGCPKTTRTSLLAMAKPRLKVRASRRAYSGIKVSIWKAFEFTFALLYHSSRLGRLLWASWSKRTLFLRLYTHKSAQFDIFTSNIRFYTLIYDWKRLFESHANTKNIHTILYVYIRLYTYANAYLKVLKISNIRLYTVIYVCKRLFGSIWDFKYAFIYDYIRLKTHESNFQNFQIYEYIRIYTF